MEVLQRPGGELATRPIHFFWVVDCSGSMYGEKIGIVNNTIQECIPEMRSAADNNPNAQLLIRALQFSSGDLLPCGEQESDLSFMHCSGFSWCCCKEVAR